MMNKQKSTILDSSKKTGAKQVRTTPVLQKREERNHKILHDYDYLKQFQNKTEQPKPKAKKRVVNSPQFNQEIKNRIIHGVQGANNIDEMITQKIQEQKPRKQQPSTNSSESSQSNQQFTNAQNYVDAYEEKQLDSTKYTKQKSQNEQKLFENAQIQKITSKIDFVVQELLTRQQNMEMRLEHKLEVLNEVQKELNQSKVAKQACDFREQLANDYIPFTNSVINTLTSPKESSSQQTQQKQLRQTQPISPIPVKQKFTCDSPQIDLHNQQFDNCLDQHFDQISINQKIDKSYGITKSQLQTFDKPQFSKIETQGVMPTTPQKQYESKYVSTPLFCDKPEPQKTILFESKWKEFQYILEQNDLKYDEFSNFNNISTQMQTQIVEKLNQNIIFNKQKQIQVLCFGNGPQQFNQLTKTRLGRKIIEFYEQEDIENMKIVFMELILAVGVGYDSVYETYLAYLQMVKSV
ncbi:Hypothetical_protein [Hexamita inflata]|uniref:Hypothetical_protein n=1 Tax=Hexamita inflata TaxID=28002 RepID=A0AA86P125_9EUKA|nr:Hypothetical protein HINF_LOCUS17331 [Hexamita inflata]